MTAALLLALALAVPAARPAAPAGPPPPPADAAELQARLDAALGGYHAHPSPEAWRALGPAAAPELARLAQDPSAPPSRRARALEGLSYVGGAEADATVRRLAVTEGLPPSLRLEALRGAGRLVPASELGALLGPVLRGAARPVERAGAAEVLAAHAPAACAEIRARQAQEPPSARAAYDLAVDRCAAARR